MKGIIGWMLSVILMICGSVTDVSAPVGESPAGTSDWHAASQVTEAEGANGTFETTGETNSDFVCAGEETHEPVHSEESPVGSGEEEDGGIEETQDLFAPAEYDPLAVVALATQKCIAGGMIQTTDNLNALLAAGEISEEIYAAFYPYDGLGYYSVFVETDLNRAATTSGRLLVSAEGIADYVAGMLLLEREPYFLIEYGGVTQYGGTAYYEFRCYR